MCVTDGVGNEYPSSSKTNLIYSHTGYSKLILWSIVEKKIKLYCTVIRFDKFVSCYWTFIHMASWTLVNMDQVTLCHLTGTITWINADLLWIRTLRIKLQWNLSQNTFSIKKMHLEMLLGKKWQPISVDQCKKDIIPMLTHWSYIFLSLTHRFHLSLNVLPWYCTQCSK